MNTRVDELLASFIKTLDVEGVLAARRNLSPVDKESGGIRADTWIDVFRAWRGRAKLVDSGRSRLCRATTLGRR